MNRISSFFNALLLAVLLVIGVLLIARDALAANSEMDSEQSLYDGKVEVVYASQTTLPYRERRGNWSGVFGINLEQMLPDKFRSKISNDSYNTLYGTSPIPMAQVEVGAQYNFGIGSLGASLVYGYGGVKDSRSGTDRVLNLSKRCLNFQYTMDTFFEEPYIAPYVKTSLTSFAWEDTGFSQPTKTGVNGLSMGLTAGALIQLNAIDPDAALQARNNSGITNTYLDIYISQFYPPNGDGEPDFESSMNIGAGLKLEF